MDLLKALAAATQKGKGKKKVASKPASGTKRAFGSNSSAPSKKSWPTVTSQVLSPDPVSQRASVAELLLFWSQATHFEEMQPRGGEPHPVPYDGKTLGEHELYNPNWAIRPVDTVMNDDRTRVELMCKSFPPPYRKYLKDMGLDEANVRLRECAVNTVAYLGKVQCATERKLIQAEKVAKEKKELETRLKQSEEGAERKQADLAAELSRARAEAEKAKSKTAASLEKLRSIYEGNLTKTNESAVIEYKGSEAFKKDVFQFNLEYCQSGFDEALRVVKIANADLAVKTDHLFFGVSDEDAAKGEVESEEEEEEEEVQADPEEQGDMSRQIVNSDQDPIDIDQPSPSDGQGVPATPSRSTPGPFMLNFVVIFLFFLSSQCTLSGKIFEN